MKAWLAAMIMGLALSSMALSGTALAAIEAHEFASDAELARYRHLADILRCPKCQNQNIAESNSPIAADLRAEVRRMLAAATPTNRSSSSWSNAMAILCCTSRRSTCGQSCCGWGLPAC